jgi:hypothetical protein
VQEAVVLGISVFNITLLPPAADQFGGPGVRRGLKGAGVGRRGDGGLGARGGGEWGGERGGEGWYWMEKAGVWLPGCWEESRAVEEQSSHCRWLRRLVRPDTQLYYTRCVGVFYTYK